MLQNGEHSHLTNPYILYNRIRDGVVRIVNRLGTGQPGNLGSIPGTRRRLLISKDCKLVLVESSLLPNGYSGCFPSGTATAA
jgi:hypothetical protein